MNQESDSNDEPAGEFSACQVICLSLGHLSSFAFHLFSLVLLEENAESQIRSSEFNSTLHIMKVTKSLRFPRYTARFQHSYSSG